MTIFVFGANGMLGKYLIKVIKDAVPITRNEFNIEVDLGSSKLHFIKKTDIVINCAGVIPQRVKMTELRTYIKVNTLFPHLLCTICDNVIHITTDCVYNGEVGNYTERDIGTETNIYGVSKNLGEPENACVIRTSIIGEEENNKKSLLEWVLSQKNGRVHGYTNVYWNGVTCLFLAEFIRGLIETNTMWKGVRHLYGETVSKCEMIEMINEIYNLNLEIIKDDSVKSNKTLSTIYDEFFVPKLREMILNQKEY